MEVAQLKSLTVKELSKLADELKIKDYTSLKKQDLIKLIFEAQTKNELTELIACHIENMTASNPALDTVLIECDGNVRGGDFEIVKSGVCQSSGQSTRKLFLGIRDEAKITDDN